jgi:hypothetical protein
MHRPFGAYRVETATVWVISSYNPRSFDSRYFGPVNEDRIRHHLRALLTLKSLICAALSDSIGLWSSTGTAAPVKSWARLFGPIICAPHF